MIPEPLARTIAAGGIAVLAFDAMGSYASHRFGFAYTNLVIGSLLIYVLVGVAAAGHTGSIRAGSVAGEAVAAIEATLGWAISWQIGPGRIPDRQATPAGIATRIIAVIAIGTICGAIGAAISKAW